jgi:uncharacterized protein YecE (DUF72 family)
MITVGLSGFSYRDWMGPFYPPGTRERERLPYYAREFDTVELNVTFYALPAARTVAAWVDRTPPGFRFAVKAHRSLTHERHAPQFEGFRAAVAPLATAGKLACVLAQFPPSFRPGQASLAHLAQLRAGLAGWPVAVEFRHAAWAEGDHPAALRPLDLAWVAVDEPDLPGLLPRLAVATAPPAYVRFHGRNAARWHKPEHARQRYDYLYSEAELAEWVPALRRLEAEAGEVLVYFNNAWQGQGIANARMLRALVKELPQE